LRRHKNEKFASEAVEEKRTSKTFSSLVGFL
jgi:hypothetical protein